MKKKFLSVMLSAAMVLGLTPSSALAQTYEKTEDIPIGAPDENVVRVPWADRLVETPELQVPASQEMWEVQRANIRDMVIDTLGSLPPRPETVQCRTYETGDTPALTYEKFYLDNGYGDMVPGTIYIPKGLTEKAPAILYLHYHGDEFETGQNELLFSWPLAESGQPLVDKFIERGYVVMAIDAYAFTTRSGMGPGYVPGTDEKETGLAEEASLYKYLTVQGISYMGMIIRDDQIALDYLTTRPEIDPERIGITGMSMGGTRANWLAALDERVKVTVSVACLTRMQDFIRTGNIKWHAFFNWVPGMLAKFDTESVVSLIAPRPYMQLMGDSDIGSPVEGVRYIQQKTEQVYALYGASDKLEFHYYEGLDHDYLPEEFELMLSYFDSHL